VTPLLDYALRSSAVLAAGLLASMFLRHRSPALRHAVLAATLLAAPLVGPLGRALPPIEVAWPSSQRAAAPGEMLTAVVTSDSADASGGASEDASESAVATSVLAPSADVAMQWIGIAWLAGAVAGLCWLAVAIGHLAVATRRTRPVRQANWREGLAQVLDEGGLDRHVDLRHSPRGDLLATWGWRRPCVLVPAAALDWPAERIHAVLAHELAHVRRHDWPLQIAAVAVRNLLWWNPLAWVACRRLALHAEQACDDAVLARGVPPQTYASHLLAVARVFQPHRVDAAIATPMARPSTLQQRIIAMLNPRLDRAGLTRRTISAIAVSCLVVTASIAALRGAQSTRALEGVIFDPTGAVLPGVHLTLKAGDAAPAVEAATDAAGRFVFAAVAPGTYTLKAEVRGFKEFNQQVTLDSDDDYDRAITLQVGDLRETIVIRQKRTAAAQPTAAGPAPVRVGGNIKPPKKTKDVKPVYPASMRDAGREGVVPIEATIDTNGKVTNARLLTADVHPDFAVAALEAVRGWEFTPTLLNGKPVNVVMNVSLTFELED